MKGLLPKIILILAIANFGFAGGALHDKVKEGNKLYGDKKYDEALVKYNDAQIESPNSPEVFFNMGNVFYRQKKYKEAVEAYRKA
ncbi:MAG: tetratricopeptide repeat protein, partial [Candidatus Omnitrophica bacterium]|nr:tetratricopeptide repeat protein [Candidatus Omnitrophota bacterium]